MLIDWLYIEPLSIIIVGLLIYICYFPPSMPNWNTLNEFQKEAVLDTLSEH